MNLSVVAGLFSLATQPEETGHSYCSWAKQSDTNYKTVFITKSRYDAFNKLRKCLF